MIEGYSFYSDGTFGVDRDFYYFLSMYLGMDDMDNLDHVVFHLHPLLGHQDHLDQNHDLTSCH
jgi:hypothetical protein